MSSIYEGTLITLFDYRLWMIRTRRKRSDDQNQEKKKQGRASKPYRLLWAVLLARVFSEEKSPILPPDCPQPPPLL
jgi:hypothetical protein